MDGEPEGAELPAGLVESGLVAMPVALTLGFLGAMLAVAGFKGVAPWDYVVQAFGGTPKGLPGQPPPDLAASGPAGHKAAQRALGVAGYTVGAAAVRAAETQLGVPYRWGGESPKGSPNPGFDCSGLTQWAYKQAGVSIPRVTTGQIAVGKVVRKADLEPGDLLFYYFHDGGLDPGHVVMYVGSGRVIQAPQTGQVVEIVPVYWSGFVGARRPPRAASILGPRHRAPAGAGVG